MAKYSYLGHTYELTFFYDIFHIIKLKIIKRSNFLLCCFHFYFHLIFSQEFHFPPNYLWVLLPVICVCVCLLVHGVECAVSQIMIKKLKNKTAHYFVNWKLRCFVKKFSRISANRNSHWNIELPRWTNINIIVEIVSKV